MRTPDEIKKGMLYCVEPYCPGEKCPYWNAESCAQDKTYDALDYIQQLEADNAQLNRCIENMTDKLNAANDEVAKLQAERDAACLKNRCIETAHMCYDGVQKEE